MSLSSPFIERPVATTLLSLSVVMVGVLGYMLLPVSPLPQVDFPAISVSASLPGASPETMASSIATPLERALGTIAGVNQIDSQSSQGSTRIFIQFDLGKNIDTAAREVQAAINASRSLLPSSLPGMPQYRKINPSQAPIMLLALTSKTATSSELYDLASTVLAQKVAQVIGVGDVTVGGGSLPAVRVELQPQALTQYGISLDQVRQSISGANLLRPKGIIEDGERHWQIQASDQLTKAADYRPLVIAYRGDAPVRLQDVANVYDGIEDRYNAGYFNNENAVLLVVSRQPQANIIATVDGVMEQLPALRAFLPAGVSLDVASDRSPTIRATLQEAQRTLLIAVALVVFVVLLFLANFRAAMIPVTAVPVALVGSCAVMYLWGFSLNNLSLMALIVATGLVVDDAIVVLENISRHVEEGMAPMAAALQGAREVGFTLLSMNLSLVAVFVSILFMGGIVERLFREFSITLVAAILISLVVSLTLTPMLCARWLSARRLRPGRLQRISDAVFGRLRRGYGRSLDWALHHAPIILMLFIGVAALNVHLYMKAPKSFLPDQDTGQLGGFIRGDDGMSFQIMQPKIDAFRKAVLKDPAVESVAGFIGGGRGINNAQIFVRLKPLKERMVSAQVVADRIRRNLPPVAGARMFLNVDQDIRFGGGFGRGTYSYTLRADDLGLLRVWGQRIRSALSQLPEVTGIEDELISSQQITLDVDREAARQLGIEMNTVTQALNNAFGQRQVSTIYNAMNQYRVVMEVAPRFAQGPEALDEVYVVTAAGRVPLSSFSHYTRSTANDRVSRNDQFASTSIGFELAPNVSLSQAETAINRAVSLLTMPSSVQGRLQGNASLFQRMQGNQPVAILGTLLVVYIVLGVLYESYVHPLTILSTLPSAGVGALIALLLLKTDFSLVALLGVFLLIGVVMKNAILMIDVALQIERERNATPIAAIREACLLRLRPILMTTMAALLGALPLMLGEGEGAELRRPLGIAIVGGLAMSQILTLYTTPVVYLYLEEIRTKFSRRRAARRHAPPRPSEDTAQVTSMPAHGQ
ncbi:Multidrug transporter MdtC [Luteitalea pratensis]|uniref:Multidrug transporter MdtC n=1 Tax=Luteitalea pratensis TaxID=1855912 RepID=A0A143PW84_LUTPR|nr:efflux RND transporter permease subunit [Luteitalea pratensis]AMY12094.1 Multidrug transporter MdtC [Luteitalea pratensis]